MNIARFVASASEATNSGGGAAIAQLGIFAVIGLVMYFLLIRPQRKRQRQAMAEARAIEIGDEAITTAGIYGFVTALEGDIAWLEIDNDVQIRISRAALARKVSTDTAAPAAPEAESAGSDD
ncbi:MAG: putative preprotein translocase YajC subunit [Actinomycetota bacterium]|jgi:preprotein translocase subunit YajC